MKMISRVVFHLCDMFEAERRDLVSVVRDEAQRITATAASMLQAVVWIALSIPLLISGYWMLAAGGFFWLEPRLGRAGAMSILGFISLLSGVGCLQCVKVACTHRTM